uniref:hypothetical protein n=1 Tax=Polynucleobacter sp. TaxID=2029855 RepID=UPI004047AE07
MIIYSLLFVFAALLTQENITPTAQQIPPTNTSHELTGYLIHESTGSVGAKVCSYNTIEGPKHVRTARDKECKKSFSFSR